MLTQQLVGISLVAISPSSSLLLWSSTSSVVGGLGLFWMILLNVPNLLETFKVGKVLHIMHWSFALV